MAVQRMYATPFEQRPALYLQLEKEGLITAAKRKEWTDGWAVKNRERPTLLAAQKKEKDQRRRWLEFLTPAQRLDLEMRERELQARQQQQDSAMAWQAEQQRQAKIKGALHVAESFGFDILRVRLTHRLFLHPAT